MRPSGTTILPHTAIETSVPQWNKEPKKKTHTAEQDVPIVGYDNQLALIVDPSETRRSLRLVDNQLS